MKIEGKNIILTGASSGIGKELLSLLSKYNDVKIIAVARNVSEIEWYEGKVIPFSVNLSSKEGVDSLFEFSQNTFGNTDLFIANAGYGYLERLSKPDWQHIENIFSLNVISPIYSLEKLIQESNSSKNFVFTVSCVAMIPLPVYSLYSSTKAALHQFVKAYRYEKSKNLNITCVYPIATRTKFFEKAAKEENPPLPFPTQSVEKVARAIIKGIEKDKKQVFPSIFFKLIYPFSRLFPFLIHIYSLMEKKKADRWLDNHSD